MTKSSRAQHKSRPRGSAAANKASSARPFLDDERPLPSEYPHTQLTLIARDPFWMHAYWDMDGGDLASLRQQMGGNADQAVLVLRVYDITLIDFDGANANHFFDIDVGPVVRSWDINVWQDNCAFCAEIGLRQADGRFYPLTRSNPVMTPRVGRSERSEMIWMNVSAQQNTPEMPYVNYAPADQPSVASAAGPQEGLPPDGDRKSGKHQFPSPVVASPLTRRRYLTEEDIRAYYIRMFPVLRRLRRRRRKAPAKISALRAAIDKSHFLAQLAEGTVTENAVIPGLSSEWYARRFSVGDSADLAVKSLSSQDARPGFNEAAASTHLLPEHAKGRTFFFEIGAELIVYGRTEPDAEVRLGGRKIDLRPDGTFTLRYALPDGKIPFDFVAEAADKLEQRRITTSVERTKTMYSP